MTSEHFVFTLRAAKAAMRAYAALPTDDLFQLALEAVRTHDNAKRAYLAHLAATQGQLPLHPKTDT